MKAEQKQQALQNALRFFNFYDKYFVVPAEKRIGHKFAIATKTDRGGIELHTHYMSYDEFNAYLFGYKAAEEKQFTKKIEQI